ncbi:MAG: nucleotidyltransferase domain-containing protein [Microcystaceae cyanobacterium]
MTLSLKTILAQLKQELQNYYGDRLNQLILFGSQARGDAHPDSDIDVLVVLKGNVNMGDEIENTNSIIARLSLEKDAVISCIFMDEYRFIHRFGPLLRNIRKEGIVL